jgi:Cu(I)/Ag(I) efflux system membrane fusion protein
MKNAFVATDAKQGSEAAKTLLSELPLIDMSLLKGDAHLYWMEQLSAIQEHSEKISELEDVEEQRKQFDFLSQALIKTIKVFGVADDSLYVEHCPMAFDNTGADWLSEESEIRNPYFGDKMMKCGIVKDTITKDFKNPSMKMAPNFKPGGDDH